MQRSNEKKTRQDKHTHIHTHSLGATSSPSLKLATLDWALKSGDVKLQDIFSPIGTVSGSPEGCSMAWTYFQDVRYTDINIDIDVDIDVDIGVDIGIDST